MRAAVVFRATVARQGDQVRAQSVRTQSLGEPISVEAGQADVDQGYIRFEMCDRIEAARPVGGRVHGMALVLEDPLQAEARVFRVLYDHDTTSLTQARIRLRRFR